MSDDFLAYVEKWDALVGEISADKAALKEKTVAESAMREGIVRSVYEILGKSWREGVNTYPLSNGRKLKITYSKKRAIDPALISVARAQFEKLNDRPEDVVFDELLRTKYELVMAAYKKLPKDSPAAKAISYMLVTSENKSTMVLD